MEESEIARHSPGNPIVCRPEPVRVAVSWLTSHCLILALSWVGIRLWLHLADPDGSLCAVGPLASLCGDGS